MRKLTSSMRDERLSDRVCQASATIATEWVAKPASNLITNKIKFKMIDNQPSQ